MENTQNTLLPEDGQVEREILAVAEEVLGAVPEWFWEHKDVIQKNREEQKEWTDQITSEINEFLQRFEQLRQKVTTVRSSRLQ